ncbi:MAG: hypothetical protein K8R67_12905 [Desulfobacteraceae bacterium]|nr:hypothetical protein [Desulfobacteraceae bacterium]
MKKFGIDIGGENLPVRLRSLEIRGIVYTKTALNWNTWSCVYVPIQYEKVVITIVVSDFLNFLQFFIVFTLLGNVRNILEIFETGL